MVVVRVPAVGEKKNHCMVKFLGETQKSLSQGKAYTDLVKGFW